MRPFFGLASPLVAVTLGLGAAGSVPADVVAMGLGIALGAVITVPVSLLVMAGGQTGQETSTGPVASAANQAAPPPYSLLGRYDTQPLVLVKGVGWEALDGHARAPAQLDVATAHDVGRRVQVVGEPAA